MLNAISLMQLRGEQDSLNYNAKSNDEREEA